VAPHASDARVSRSPDRPAARNTDHLDPPQRGLPVTEPSMPLPELEPEQRRAALAKAAEARRIRAELKQMLKSGEISIAEVLDGAERSEALAKMRVSDVLEAMPAHGPVKAQRLMDELQIAPSRRLRGLGRRQREGLLATFERRS
jgi:hypothetical protein